MSPALQLIAAEFRRQGTYRLALLAGVFTNGVFGMIRAGVLLAAVAAGGGVIGGYDAATALLYVLWGQALLGTLPMWGWAEVVNRVRTGDIAVDLTRPMDVQAYFWFRDLGRAGMQFLARGLPILVLGCLILQVIPIADPLTLLLGFVTVVLALGINFLCRFALNLISFWTLETQGFMILYMVGATLLSGFVLPIHMYPAWMAGIANLSPFPSMYQAPVDVLSGRVSGAGTMTLWGIQLIWLVLLLAGTRLMLHFGTRRLVVQGG